MATTFLDGNTVYSRRVRVPAANGAARVSGPASERREDLARFYAEGYDAGGADAERLGAWRALGARAKADHVEALCARVGLRPGRVVEVGCGDGALLAELRAGFASEPRATSSPHRRRARAGARPGCAPSTASACPSPRTASTSRSSPRPRARPQPVALLGEAGARRSRRGLEVPLEANISAGRPRSAGARPHRHLHRLSRGAVRDLVRRAGLEVAAELSDPLTREAHAFFVMTPSQRARAAAKAAVRRGVHRAAPRAAERLFTVHYACLARRA